MPELRDTLTNYRFVLRATGDRFCRSITVACKRTRARTCILIRFLSESLPDIARPANFFFFFYVSQGGEYVSSYSKCETHLRRVVASENGDCIHYNFNSIRVRKTYVKLEMTAVVHVRSILMSVKLQVQSMNRARLIATRCEPMLPISTNQRAFRESPRDIPGDRYALSHAQCSFTYTSRRARLLREGGLLRRVKATPFPSVVSKRNGATGHGINCCDCVLIDNEGH